MWLSARVKPQWENCNRECYPKRHTKLHRPIGFVILLYRHSKAFLSSHFLYQSIIIPSSMHHCMTATMTETSAAFSMWQDCKSISKKLTKNILLNYCINQNSRIFDLSITVKHSTTWYSDQKIDSLKNGQSVEISASNGIVCTAEKKYRWQTIRFCKNIFWRLLPFFTKFAFFSSIHLSFQLPAHHTPENTMPSPWMWLQVNVRYGAGKKRVIRFKIVRRPNTPCIDWNAFKVVVTVFLNTVKFKPLRHW